MKILIIEDDFDLCKTMQYTLKKNDYESDICQNGEESLIYIKQYNYELIILDRMLPMKDGLSVLQEMRKLNITSPVIMVTAMNQLNDRIDGLDAGADDYLVKPFDLKELLARIRALLRRPGSIQNTNSISYANVNLTLLDNRLSGPTQTILLSKKEASLLEFFIKNHDQTLCRDQILSRIWGTDTFAESSCLDSYVYFLRKRLSTVCSDAVIKTIYGIGYRMETSRSK